MRQAHARLSRAHGHKYQLPIAPQNAGKKLIHLLTCIARNARDSFRTQKTIQHFELFFFFFFFSLFIRPPLISWLCQPAAILTGAKLLCVACGEPTLCSPLPSYPRACARVCVSAGESAWAQAPTLRTFSNRARILRRLRPTDGAPLVGLQLNPQLQRSSPPPLALLPPFLSIISLSSSAPVFLC